MRRLILVVFGLGVNLAVGVSFGATAETDKLLDGLIARSQALQTGTIHFKITRKTYPAPPGTKTVAVRVVKLEDGTTYLETVYGIPASEVPANALIDESARVVGSSGVADAEADAVDTKGDNATVQEMMLTIAGLEWVRRWPDYQGVEISRGGFDATYTENVNPDSSMSRALLIEPPKGTLREHFWNQPWRRVVRCGSVPFPEMLDYISAHREQAEYGGKESLDGTDAEILEWSVDQPDFNSVFHYHLPYLYEGRTAKLRVFVASDLGHAIPRVEFASVNGEAKFWFEASDFRSVGDSVYFPFGWKMINEAGGTHTLLQFEILSVEGINEPIPDGAFELAIPSGTRVRNRLPGQEAVFRVGEDIKTDDIDSILASTPNAGRGLPDESSRGRTHAILVGTGILALVMLAAWFVTRRFMPQKGG